MSTTIGQIIKKAIKRSGKKQVDFAKEIGKSQQLLSDWINERRQPCPTIQLSHLAPAA